MLVKSSLIPKSFDALTVWPFIFIRPEHEKNAALIAHEMVHYKEQKAAWLIPWLLKYIFSRKFRLAAEQRAYAVQVAMGGLTETEAEYYLSLY